MEFHPSLTIINQFKNILVGGCIRLPLHLRTEGGYNILKYNTGVIKLMKIKCIYILCHISYFYNVGNVLQLYFT